MMKRISALVTAVLLLAFGSGIISAQSGYDLYQKALVKERAVGDVEEAIRLYQRVVKEHASNRSLAAKAQLRIGLLYERIGRKADAQRAFQTVVSQYADQADVVRQAQAKLPKGAGIEMAGAGGFATSSPAIRQVWAGPDVDTGGGPSPDGRYLSFLLRGNVAVRDLATGEIRRITNISPDAKEEADEIIWSPDGKQLAYAVWNCRAKCIEEVRVIGLDGSKSRVLYHNEETVGNALSGWSPDGRYILAGFDQRDGTRQIVRVAVADGSVQVIKKIEEYRLGDIGLSHVSLSPDGRYLVYGVPVHKDSFRQDVFLLSTDGGRETALIQHPADDRMLGWAPDGKTILFASDRSGAWDAWRISVVEGKVQGSPERIRREVGQVLPMGFTRNGSFYYSVSTGLSEIYLATLDPETGKLASRPKLVSNHYTGNNEQPAWSPDGQYLVYRSVRGIRGFWVPGIISILSIDTGQHREIVPQVSRFARPHFSPEGQLLVWGFVGEKSGELKVDEQTGAVSPYVGTGGNKRVFFASTDSIRVRNPDTGEEKIVYRAPQPIAVSSAWGWRGQRLAFIMGNALMVMRVDGEARELLKLKEPEKFRLMEGTVWTPDGRYILFVKKANENAPDELWSIPAEGGQAQNLGVAMEELSELRFHPDGHRLAFTAGKKNASEVWVMENFLPAAQTRKSSTSRR